MPATSRNSGIGNVFLKIMPHADRDGQITAKVNKQCSYLNVRQSRVYTDGLELFDQRFDRRSWGAQFLTAIHSPGIF
jgi:hypothetical protein